MLALPSQTRERPGAHYVHELGLVAERAFVVDAGAHQFPEQVGGIHRNGCLASSEPCGGESAFATFCSPRPPPNSSPSLVLSPLFALVVITIVALVARATITPKARCAE